MSFQTGDFLLVNRGGQSFKTEYGLLKQDIIAGVGGAIVSETEPTGSYHEGDFWYQPSTDGLFIWVVSDTTGVVTSVTVRNGGSGYTSNETNVSTAGGDGEGLTLDIQAGAGGSFASPTVNQGGSGYAVNNVVFLTGAGNQNGSATVTAVNTVATGAWEAVDSGIEDAPSDGSYYGRQDGNWEVVTPEAPNDGSHYGRQDGNWEVVTPEAPSDGSYYGRQNNNWEVVTPEAPLDGQQYARQSGAWSVVTGGGGGGTTINYSGAAAWGKVASDGTLEGGLNIQSVAFRSPNFFDIVFTNAMPNANYAVTSSSQVSAIPQNQTANGFTIEILTTTIGDSIGRFNEPFAFAVHALNALPPQGGTGADAWVEFDGTSAIGTDCTIRASFNVSRVEHIQTGAYTIHFTNPMPTSNYATFNNANVNVNTSNVGGVSPAGVINSTTSYTIRCAGGETSTPFDCAFVSSMVHCTNAQLPDTVTQEQIEAAINNPGASAWVLCNGDGTTQSSLNIASTTRTGLGTYDVVFATPMPSADYSVQLTIAAATYSVIPYNTAKTVNGFSVKIANSDNLNFDFAFSAVVHATNALPPRGGTGADAWAAVSADGNAAASFNATTSRTAAGTYQVTFNTPMPSAAYTVNVTSELFGAALVSNSPTVNGFEYITYLANGTLTDGFASVVVHATNAQLPNTVTQEQIEAAISSPGASAWGSFESNGTFNGGLNIASITPNVSASPYTGNGYLVTFATPMPNADYAVSTTSHGSPTIVVLNKTTTSFLLAGVRDTGGGVTTAVGLDFTVHAANAQLPDTITMQMWDDLVARVTALENA